MTKQQQTGEDGKQVSLLCIIWKTLLHYHSHITIMCLCGNLMLKTVLTTAAPSY